MRRPRLKRRHDADVLPCPRPGLNFSKMTQAEQCSAFSPAEFLGRGSIGPLSESEEEEEEEEEEDQRKRTLIDGGQKMVFERDCTELDLNLIEEN
ncbi:unnamed protein product [Pleuronectes platessa]|uniref:Uncharacterized protein n=2 Tax=Pleuronectes platessa TaxID=8262 RepID=A0A9N7TIE7_PLEPL|nr:unnamed protein product [Pleuronectes platessa]